MVNHNTHDPINALIERCEAFLADIEHIELEITDLPFLSKLEYASKTFAETKKLIAKARALNVIQATTFMQDKQGRSHWIGDDAEIKEDKTEEKPLKIGRGDITTAFNYKAHCRVPIRTVLNAACKIEPNPEPVTQDLSAS